MRRIWRENEANKLAEEIASRGWTTTLCSGFFDPIHLGHLRFLQASVGYTDKLIVIVNSDNECIHKKGYVFMPIEHKLEIIATLRHIDFVIDIDAPETTQYIKLFKPLLLTNGGDRSTISQCNKNEVAACNSIGCEIRLGVGGSEKITSSSTLVENVISKYGSSY